LFRSKDSHIRLYSSSSDSTLQIQTIHPLISIDEYSYMHMSVGKIHEAQGSSKIEVVL
jgi:hypothetical protein